MKQCPKCNKDHEKQGIFCSRICANSRGARTQEFKDKISSKLKGKSQTEDIIRKRVNGMGFVYNKDKPNTICIICKSDTKSKNRKTCSHKCLLLLRSQQSQIHPNCGGQKHTNRQKIFNIKGESFTSESSYETKLSELLNSLNVLWIRPNFLWYEDLKGNKRRYYPDFYLPNLNLYLDPKNEYLIKTDISKIIRASEQNNKMIVILGEKYINRDFILKLVGDRGNAPLLPACKTGTLLLS